MIEIGHRLDEIVDDNYVRVWCMWSRSLYRYVIVVVMEHWYNQYQDNLIDFVDQDYVQLSVSSDSLLDIPN